MEKHGILLTVVLIPNNKQLFYFYYAKISIIKILCTIILQ